MRPFAEANRPDSNRGLREELIQRLLITRKELPTAPLSRLGRTAMTALRIQRAAVSGRQGQGELDIETIARIVGSIGQLKGTAMKMGQIMSYIDVALPAHLQEALSVLQTHAQPMPIDQARSIVADELPGRSTDLLSELEPNPVAAASIGQVHRGRLPDGTWVAVKIQYPEVEEAIRNDFKPAAAASAIASLVYRGARIDDFIAEARARFLEECDYRHEAAAQRRFATLYSRHPTIVVPEVHLDYCSRRVLTSTWLSGSSFAQFLEAEPTQPKRDQIGHALFEFYVGSLFSNGIYNCDPHPGNYVFLEDGRIGMLDYGCTRAFEGAFAAKLARLTLAVHRDDRELLHRAFLDLGMVREDSRYDFETARDLVRAFYGPMLKDSIQQIDLGESMSMRDVFERKRELMRLHLPGEFLFLFRIRFGLLSILAKLGARANWYRLERQWALAAS
ncbi:MAG: AarF/ABC1/UbiB kinase family protein [Polyangiales bacterium]